MSTSTNNHLIHPIASMATHAAAAFVLASPIGATGGAIYGFCYAVSSIIATELIKKNTRIFQITIFFVSVFSGWQIAAALGVNMSLKSAIFLSVVSLSMGVALSFTVVSFVGIAYATFLIARAILGQQTTRA